MAGQASSDWWLGGEATTIATERGAGQRCAPYRQRRRKEPRSKTASSSRAGQAQQVNVEGRPDTASRCGHVPESERCSLQHDEGEEGGHAWDRSSAQQQEVAEEEEQEEEGRRQDEVEEEQEEQQGGVMRAGGVGAGHSKGVPVPEHKSAEPVAATATEQRVEAAVIGEGRGVVVVSLSGGVDSMVLCRVLCAIRARWAAAADGGGRRLLVAAVHIDYANRRESADEALFLQKWCFAMGIDLRVRRVEGLRRGLGDRDLYEQATRAIRFEVCPAHTRFELYLALPISASSCVLDAFDPPRAHCIYDVLLPLRLSASR